MSTPVLCVDRLAVGIRAAHGERLVTNDVSFSINQAEIVGLAGESGSGKSMTALAIMRLLPHAAHIADGSVSLAGRNLATLNEHELDALRGRDMAMIFQEPMTSLNPLFRSGFQIGEVLEVHRGLSRRQARAKAIELMQATGIPAAEHRVDSYPHQLSGGMRQRVMIAMAMACEPRLLLADEPTTALDVSIQSQILALIRRLRDANGMAVLLITHDLGVISAVADKVIIMYAGQIMETAPSAAFFAGALHPYSGLLLKSMPRLREKLDRLPQIPGAPPLVAQDIRGCRFHPRCPLAIDRCRMETPPLELVEAGRTSRCWRSAEIRARGRLP